MSVKSVATAVVRCKICPCGAVYILRSCPVLYEGLRGLRSWREPDPLAAVLGGKVLGRPPESRQYLRESIFAVRRNLPESCQYMGEKP